MGSARQILINILEKFFQLENNFRRGSRVDQFLTDNWHLKAFWTCKRDLKTQNIFLTSSEVIKLGDLGIARELGAVFTRKMTIFGRDLSNAKF